jgi:hypothetical protein
VALLAHAMPLLAAKLAALHEAPCLSETERYGLGVRAMLDSARSVAAPDLGTGNTARQKVRSVVLKLFDEIEVVVLPGYCKGAPI